MGFDKKRVRREQEQLREGLKQAWRDFRRQRPASEIDIQQVESDIGGPPKRPKRRA
jgi:hypothetical protein